jgi:hypothetical protein
MPAATIPLQAELPPRKPPQFPVSAFYAEQARKALEVFGLALQLPIPGLAGHKPNLPGFPLSDTVSYLRSAVTSYMLTNDDRFCDLFDWDKGDFPATSDEQFVLDWADGLIEHLIDRWQWRHLLAAHEAQIGDWRPDMAMRTWNLDRAFQATRPTLKLDEHQAIGQIVSRLRALLDRIAPGGPRMIDGQQAMFSGPMVAYLESFREDEDEGGEDAA